MVWVISICYRVVVKLDEIVKNNVALGDVSNQRELLLDFQSWLDTSSSFVRIPKRTVEEYLSIKQYR